MVNSINTNIAAYYAQANIGVAAQAASKSVARLSSGNRIVNSSDDVAALSIGSSLRTSVSALRTALINSAQGGSLLQIADGALSQITEILQRQKAIALQAGSGSLSDTDRGFLDQEFQALSDEIDRLSENTNFNGVNLIDGSLSGSNPLQSAAAAHTATVSGFTAQTALTAVTFADNGGGSLGDTTFYGDLSEGIFEVQFDAVTGFNVTFTINGSTYVGIEADITDTGLSLTLTNGEGNISFAISTDISGTYAASTAGAALFQTALENAFEAATAFSNRVLRSTDATGIEGSGITTADTNGTLLEGMDGGDVALQSQFWDSVNAPTISDFGVIGTFGVGTKFSVTIDGKNYITGALTDATDLSGNGGAAAIIAGIANNTLRFYLDGDATANPAEFFDINLSDSVQVIDVDTEENVNAFLNDLNNIFGRSGGGLSFQIGASATDTLGVSIAAATTAALFEGEEVNVLTQGAATTASAAVSVALESVAALRAGVGALQSRFNFASAAIQSSIQNQDGARSVLLDTDIAEESTAYATSQVKLQAGISVLAQANQQLQSLLKLIG